jgi:hypothetical protein
MSDFFGKIKSGAGKVAFEADKMNRLNKARSELEKIKNQIQVQFMKLGEMYYTQRANAAVTGPAYDEICQSIVALEDQVESKNRDIQRISAENYAPQGTQPAPQPFSGPAQYPPTPISTQTSFPQTPAQAASTTKFCPNCGKEIPVAARFCTECGANL